MKAVLFILFFDAVRFALCRHPYLYYSSEDVEGLRHKARTSHHHIFSRLRQAANVMKRTPQVYIPPSNWTDFSRSWNENYGNNLVALAFYCVLNTRDHDAFELAKKIVTSFTALKNWRCALNLDDDVPVAHSLVAMATAYDFLWDRLDERQRQLTAEKIKRESRVMYERSFQKWWGRTYIQNHVVTNYVALMTGALVLEKTTETNAWKQKAHLMLNRTMFLLSFVKDGTLEEGVSYASYTSRSLTQYIALAKRHFNVDFTENDWLKQHFWFIYRTILPTFDETLGIADSNGKWFYGPESQLVFLDSMVIKTGHGNWLAKKIQLARKDGKTLFLADAHRFDTLHTEFLFYDEKIEERPPLETDVPRLYTFEDWGVVVVGLGAGMTRDISRRNLFTFVSFKCGVLHGKAINKIVTTRPAWPSWIKGRTQFNPGHEHPDHGSFTYYPNGVPFITEALYGPKYTWLNNALSFGCSSLKTSCFAGQITEGKKWLRFQNEKHWKGKGTILAAKSDDQRVYITGEYSRWYDETDLGLDKVFRTLLLVRSEVLLVCDTIFKKTNATLSEMSAFFHNRFSTFSIRKRDDGEHFVELTQEGKAHRIYWVSSAGKTINIQSQHAEFKAETGVRKSNFVNITTPIVGHFTTVVYIFTGDDLEVRQLEISNDLNDSLIVIKMRLRDALYSISLPSRPTKIDASKGTISDFVDIRLKHKVKIMDGNICSWRRKLAFFTSLLLVIMFLRRLLKVKSMKPLRITLFIFKITERAFDRWFVKRILK